MRLQFGTVFAVAVALFAGAAAASENRQADGPHLNFPPRLRVPQVSLIQTWATRLC
jgi:hypothetical protein